MMSVKVPSPKTTSVAFGGPLCEDLYVTSATEHVTPSEFEEYPHAGYLFKVTGLGSRGIPGQPVRYV